MDFDTFGDESTSCWVPNAHVAVEPNLPHFKITSKLRAGPCSLDLDTRAMAMAESYCAAKGTNKGAAK
jgi:hypothetical protein